MIFLDGITWSVQRRGGIWTYFEALLDRLNADGLTYELCHHEAGIGPAEGFRPKRVGERFRRVSVPPGIDVFLSSYYRRPVQEVPSVVTVHDFVYEAMLSGAKTRVHAWQKHAAIREADQIICVSEATRADLLKYIGQPKGRIHVIHNGVSEVFRPTRGAKDHGGYVIYVGHRHRYKNFALARDAMAHLPGMDLVCVGGEPWTDTEKAETEALLTGRLITRQNVPTEQLNALMNGAVALAYPSLYEGFGIPVIEAMRAGTPAVAVPCAAVQEAGGAALLVADTGTAEDFAAQIGRCLGPERAQIVERGLEHARAFSWDRTHAQTAQILTGYL